MQFCLKTALCQFVSASVAAPLVVIVTQTTSINNQLKLIKNINKHYNGI